METIRVSSPYGALSTVGFGTTQDIVAKLREDNLLDTLERKTLKLADGIDYDECHPYG